jgi:hypothetical protein
VCTYLAHRIGEVSAASQSMDMSAVSLNKELPRKGDSENLVLSITQEKPTPLKQESMGRENSSDAVAEVDELRACNLRLKTEITFLESSLKDCKDALVDKQELWKDTLFLLEENDELVSTVDCVTREKLLLEEMLSALEQQQSEERREANDIKQHFGLTDNALWEVTDYELALGVMHKETKRKIDKIQQEKMELLTLMQQYQDEAAEALDSAQRSHQQTAALQRIRSKCRSCKSQAATSKTVGNRRLSLVRSRPISHKTSPAMSVRGEATNPRGISSSNHSEKRTTFLGGRRQAIRRQLSEAAMTYTNRSTLSVQQRDGSPPNAPLNSIECHEGGNVIFIESPVNSEKPAALFHDKKMSASINDTKPPLCTSEVSQHPGGSPVRKDSDSSTIQSEEQQTTNPPKTNPKTAFLERCENVSAVCLKNGVTNNSYKPNLSGPEADLKLLCIQEVLFSSTEIADDLSCDVHSQLSHDKTSGHGEASNGGSSLILMRASQCVRRRLLGPVLSKSPT